MSSMSEEDANDKEAFTFSSDDESSESFIASRDSSDSEIVSTKEYKIKCKKKKIQTIRVKEENAITFQWERKLELWEIKRRIVENRIMQKQRKKKQKSLMKIGTLSLRITNTI
jgi:hypothetical protein